MYPAARAELRNVLKVRTARELDVPSGSLDGPASGARCRVTVAERRAAVNQKPGKAMVTRYCVAFKNLRAAGGMVGGRKMTKADDEIGRAHV